MIFFPITHIVHDQIKIYSKILEGSENQPKKMAFFFSTNDLGNELLGFSGLELKHGIDCHNIYVCGGLKCQVEFLMYERK